MFFLTWETYVSHGLLWVYYAIFICCAVSLILFYHHIFPYTGWLLSLNCLIWLFQQYLVHLIINLIVSHYLSVLIKYMHDTIYKFNPRCLIHKLLENFSFTCVILEQEILGNIDLGCLDLQLKN